MRATTIVVPAYDEEERLDPDAFRAHVDEDGATRFLLVDDGSRDGTLSVLRDLAASRPEAIDVLPLPTNCGKAEAVRQGLRRAFASGGTYAGFWDADLSTPLEAIGDLRDVLEARADLLLATGARVRLLGRRIRRRTLRHYVGRVFATAASLTLRLPVYDTQCGAKLFRVSPAVAALFEEPFLTRWIFDVEILARMIRAHRRGGMPHPRDCVFEVPLRRWEHVGGSKVRFRDGLRAGVELWRIRRRILRGG